MTNQRPVCIFGIYQSEHALNRVVIEGFRRNGFEIVECCVRPGSFGTLRKYIELWKRAREASRREFSHVIVAVPGQSVVWIARIFFGRSIIFNACHSLFDTNVHDRKNYSALNPRAWRDYFYDWHSVRLADTILFHTRGTLEYFVEVFGARPSRSLVLYTGADEEFFTPRGAPKNEIFHVHFHGSFTPVQGVDYIVDAATHLKGKGVRVTLVGGTETRRKWAVERVEEKNVGDVITFTGRVPFASIPDHIAAADVCLGNFGSTPKSERMSIPTKLFEYIAMGKPVITADTPPVKELFINQKSVLFSRAADGGDLAEKILLLRDNHALRESIAREAHRLYRESLTYKAIIGSLLSSLVERPVIKRQ